MLDDCLTKPPIKKEQIAKPNMLSAKVTLRCPDLTEGTPPAFWTSEPLGVNVRIPMHERSTGQRSFIIISSAELFNDFS
jgi:hypothetical protein